MSNRVICQGAGAFSCSSKQCGKQAVIWEGGKKCEKYLGLFGTIWEMEIGFSKNQTDTKHLQFLGGIEIVQSQALPSQDCYLQKCPGKATESTLQTVRNTYFMRKCKSEKKQHSGLLVFVQIVPLP